MSSPAVLRDTQEIYARRLDRYVTAMRNGKADRVPIRPFAAEFTGTYAGYTGQELAHDYRKAFDAVIKCCADFDWDAAVPNMVFVWTGMTQAQGLRYFAIPGIDIEPENNFQYREPSEEKAFMKREEYDELIADPTRFLYDVWLPRVSTEFEVSSYRRSLSLVKGALAQLSYFYSFGPQIERMRTETGTVSAISGMLKAPLDILGDKLRGYVGLCFDLMEMPEKVLAACQALMPHLAQVAISGLDPSHQIPIPIWMHRGGVPFVSHEIFKNIYWRTLKPIVEAIWSRGNQVLFYAEGNWDAHLETFAELPDRAIIYHVDRGDIAHAKKVLGKKFCLSGGIPNALLYLGTPEQVKARCKEVLDIAAADGGYIMDASAIMQSDAAVENVRAMTDFTHEYGVYGDSFTVPDAPAVAAEPLSPNRGAICLPWAEKVKELPILSGDVPMLERVWGDVDAMAYYYIWNVLLI